MLYRFNIVLYHIHQRTFCFWLLVLSLIENRWAYLIRADRHGDPRCTALSYSTWCKLSVSYLKYSYLITYHRYRLLKLAQNTAGINKFALKASHCTSHIPRLVQAGPRLFSATGTFPLHTTECNSVSAHLTGGPNTNSCYLSLLFFIFGLPFLSFCLSLSSERNTKFRTMELASDWGQLFTTDILNWGWKQIRFPKNCVLLGILEDGQRSETTLQLSLRYLKGCVEFPLSPSG
jgi:hypothetical protein